MKQIIFIDGADGVGKSTLINKINCNDRVVKTALPTKFISDIIKKDNIPLEQCFLLNFIDQCSEILKYQSILLDTNVINTIIVDRSPLSNIVYYYKKLPNDMICSYFSKLQSLIGTDIQYKFYILHGKRFKKTIDDKFEQDFEVIQNRFTNWKQILDEIGLNRILSKNEKVKLIKNNIIGDNDDLFKLC